MEGRTNMGVKPRPPNYAFTDLKKIAFEEKWTIPDELNGKWDYMLFLMNCNTLSKFREFVVDELLAHPKFICDPITNVLEQIARHLQSTHRGQLDFLLVVPNLVDSYYEISGGY